MSSALALSTKNAPCTFLAAPDPKRAADLKLRVTEHNVLTASQYYSRLPTSRLATVLCLTQDEVCIRDATGVGGITARRNWAGCKGHAVPNASQGEGVSARFMGPLGYQGVAWHGMEGGGVLPVLCVTRHKVRGKTC